MGMAGPITEEEEVDQSLVAYWLLLKEYPGWRVLWFGEASSYSRISDLA